MTDGPTADSESVGTRQPVRDGVIYVVGTALQGVGVLLVVPFVTRSLGPSEFGSVSTGLVTVQLIGVVAAAGLPQVILREHHRGPDGPRRARVLGGLLMVFGGALALVGLPSVVVLASLAGTPGTQPAAVALAAAALTVVVAGQSVLRAQARPLAFLAVAITSTVVAQLAGLLTTLVHPTSTAFLTAYAATLTLAGVVGAVLTRPSPPWKDRRTVRRGLRLAGPLLPHAVAMLVLLMGDVLVVALILGTQAVATYQVALQLGNIPFVFVTALANAWGPAVFAHPAGDRWVWTARSGLVLALAASACAAGVSLLAPWLVAVAAPPSYDREAIVHLVAVLVLVAPAYLLYNGAAFAVIDTERTGSLATAAGAAATVAVVIQGALAPLGGVTAVAGARLVGYLLLAATTSWLAHRAGLRWGAGAVVGLVVVTVVAVAAGGLLPAQGWGAVLRWVLAAVVALGVVAGAATLRRRLLAEPVPT